MEQYVATSTFRPNYVIPPYVFIKEEMKACKISKRKLRKLMGYSRYDIKRLLNGWVMIDEETAEKLSEILYSPKSYWLNLQMLYNRGEELLNANMQ